MPRSWILALVTLAVLTGCVPETTQVSAPGRHADLVLSGYGYVCRISRVVDGDTVKISCDDGSSINARLMGFDTPETYSPGCAAERRLGERATSFLRREIDSASNIRLSGGGRDKYNRLLVRMYLDDQDVADLMLRNGFAVPYHGGRRISWCARLAQGQAG